MADHQSRVILSLIDKNFASGLKSAISKAKEFGASVKEHMNNAGTAMTAAGGAITAFGMSSLKSFGDTQTQLNKAAITAGGTSKNISELAAVANKMGKDLPISAEQASQAMVGMAQNGANLKQIKEQFPSIAKASTAAGADLGKTADSVQQAYNIWGGSAKQNAAILVQTANASNASIETMGDAYANVGTNAHALGIGLGTTSEAIGLLTNKGMTSARASMDLNHALTQMIKPSNTAKEMMSKLGISYTDAHGKMKPFKQILQELNTALEGYTPAQKQAALATMYGTAGEQAMLPLLDSVKDKTGNVSTSWDAYEKNMQKAAGTSKQAGKTLDSQANEMQKNVGSALEQVSGSFDDLKNTALQSQDKLMRTILNNISNFISHLQRGKDVFSQVVKGAIGLAPVLGPALLALGLFTKALSQIGTLMNPWTLLAAAVGVIATKFVEVYNSSKPLREAIKSIGDTFEDVFGKQINELLKGVKGFFDSIDGKSKNSTKGLAMIGSDLAKGIRSVNWKGIFQGFKDAIQDVTNVLKKVDWKDIFNDVKSIVGQLFDFVGKEWSILKKSGVTKTIGEAVGAIGSVIKGLLDSLTGILPSVTSDIEGITQVAAPIISVIGQIVSAIVNVIGKILQFNGALMKVHPWIGQIEGSLLLMGARFTSVFKMFHGKMGYGFFESLSSAAKWDIPNIWNSIKNFGSGVAGLFGKDGKIAKGFKTFAGFFGKDGAISKQFAKIKGVFGKSKKDGLLSKLTSQFKNAKDHIKSFGSSAAKLAKSAGKKVVNGFKTLGSLSKKVGGWLKSGFTKGFSAISKTIKKIPGLLKSGLSKAASVAKKLGSNIVSISKKLGSNALKLAKKAGNGIVNVAKFMANGFKKAMSAIGGAFKKLITLISTNPYAAAIAAIVAVVGMLVWFFTKTKTGRKMWSNFLKWFRNAWQSFKDWIGKVWHAIAGVAEYVFKKIKYYITHPVQAAKDYVKFYINTIKNIFKSLGMVNLFNIGKKIIGSLIDGLKSGYEGVKNALHNFTKDMPLHKGPMSVDEVMLVPAGHAIMSGLNKGLAEKYVDVQKTLRGITNDIATTSANMPSAFNQQLDDLSVRSRLSLQTSLQKQQIQIDRRPANINLRIAGTALHSVVDDISNEQDKIYDLESRR